MQTAIIAAAIIISGGMIAAAVYSQPTELLSCVSLSSETQDIRDWTNDRTEISTRERKFQRLNAINDCLNTMYQSTKIR